VALREQEGRHRIYLLEWCSHPENVRMRAEYLNKYAYLIIYIKAIHSEDPNLVLPVLPQRFCEPVALEALWLSGKTKVILRDREDEGGSYFYPFLSSEDIHPNQRHVPSMYKTFKDPFRFEDPNALVVDRITDTSELIPFNPNKPFACFNTGFYEETNINKFKANILRPDTLENCIKAIDQELRIRHANYIQAHPVLSEMRLANLFLGMRVMNSSILKHLQDSTSEWNTNRERNDDLFDRIDPVNENSLAHSIALLERRLAISRYLGFTGVRIGFQFQIYEDNRQNN